MVVHYAVPISSYGNPMPDPLVNDELEIQEPVGPKASSAQHSAKFVFRAKSQTLSNVFVSITLHPQLPLSGANPFQPLAAAGWTNTLLPSAGAQYESTWSKLSMAKNTEATFEVKFTPVAAAAGMSYRLTIRVNTTNYTQAFETVEPVSIT